MDSHFSRIPTDMIEDRKTGVFLSQQLEELNNRLPSDDKISSKADIGYVDNMFNLIRLSLTNILISVKEFGVKADGFTDDAPAIQKAIDSIPFGVILFFPAGTYLIGSKIRLKESVIYAGAGWITVIKQKDNANLDAIFELPSRTDRNHYGFHFRDMLIDGNKTKNTSGHGLFVNCTFTSSIKNVRVVSAPYSGIFFDGNAAIKANTNHIVDCFTYDCGYYGIFLSEFCSDMHVIGGDHGLNGQENIFINSPSSSVRNATVWASKQSGITIEKNTPNVQLWNNQVEGNAGDGIKVKSSFAFISGNKIYDNANIPTNYGRFDGIAVVGEPNDILKGITINNNQIFSGLYDGTGHHRHAISFDSYHENATIEVNSMKYQGNSVVDPSKEIVVGLVSSDITDYSWTNPYFESYMSDVQTLVNATWTKLNFNTEIVDIEGNYDLMNKQFVVPVNGIYHFDCSVMFDNTTAANTVMLSLYVNDDEANIFRLDVKNTSVIGWHMASGSMSLELKKDDIINVYAFVEHGCSTFNGKGYSRFSGKLLK